MGRVDREETPESDIEREKGKGREEREEDSTAEKKASREILPCFHNVTLLSAA